LSRQVLHVRAELQQFRSYRVNRKNKQTKLSDRAENNTVVATADSNKGKNHYDPPDGSTVMLTVK